MQDQDDQKIYLPLDITIHGIYFYRINPGIVKVKFRTCHPLLNIFDFVLHQPVMSNVLYRYCITSAGLFLSLRSSIYGAPF